MRKKGTTTIGMRMPESLKQSFCSLTEEAEKNEKEEEDLVKM